MDTTLSDRIIDASAEAIVVTDSQNRIVRINPAFTSITGYTAEEVVGRPPSALSSGKHSRSFYNDLWFALKTRGYWQGEIWNKKKNGETFVEWVSINLLYDGDGNVTHHVAFFSDITLQKEGHARMQRLAHYDALTGLGNRLLMRDRLSQAMAAAKLAGRYVAVLFIDLDRFKTVNDEFGHGVGDALLISVAARMKAILGFDDTIFRQGGDEFIVILPNIEHIDGVKFLARRLVHEISRPFQLTDLGVEVGASIGISIYPIDATSIDALLEMADLQMYQAKRTGRGRFSFGSALQSLAADQRG
ncbi:MAG: sensor domain-containing diguanylate cyclase [Ancalomicrobiaceae bacterium]|nr:sensor domain-containing diguanylate cyclase [Ancalomicrobiaceae bacterium]